MYTIRKFFQLVFCYDSHGASHLSGTTPEKILKMPLNISVELFSMIVQFVLILIGGFKKAGNGAVVEVVAR